MTQGQLDQFAAYHKLLVQWNAKINLVSRRDEPRIFDRHFLESVAVVPHLELSFPCRAADLGSGAGFPGVPLKIVLPQLDLTLIESKRKKAHFLGCLCTKLGLSSCRIACARAEDLASDPDHAQSYDVVFARAVAPIDRLSRLASPLLVPEGLLVCYRGPEAAKELSAMPSGPLVLKACVTPPTVIARPMAFALLVRS